MIQIDMEMPDRCGNCPCFHFENPMYCRVITDYHQKITAPYRAPRPEWCPLQEVPGAQARAAWNKRVHCVPAVPLDKLCEWLAGNAWHLDCSDCEAEHCDCIQLHDDSGSSPAFWKAKLTKWMEEWAMEEWAMEEQREEEP